MAVTGKRPPPSVFVWRAERAPPCDSRARASAAAATTVARHPQSPSSLLPSLSSLSSPSVVAPFTARRCVAGLYMSSFSIRCLCARIYAYHRHTDDPHVHGHCLRRRRRRRNGLRRRGACARSRAREKRCPRGAVIAATAARRRHSRVTRRARAVTAPPRARAQGAWGCGVFFVFGGGEKRPPLLLGDWNHQKNTCNCPAGRPCVWLRFGSVSKSTQEKLVSYFSSSHQAHSLGTPALEPGSRGHHRNGCS